MNTYSNYNSNFLSNFENIYKNISVYRSIIVVNNSNEAKYLKNKLIEYDHSVFTIKNLKILNKLNFNKLYQRIFIITTDLFINFINYLIDYQLYSSISLITFYKFNNSIKLLLTSYYNNITNNYHNTIII